jgi:hypothetical protein
MDAVLARAGGLCRLSSTFCDQISSDRARKAGDGATDIIPRNYLLDKLISSLIL